MLRVYLDIADKRNHSIRKWSVLLYSEIPVLVPHEDPLSTRLIVYHGRGSTPHLSHKDPSDDQKVITISYETANGTRVTSIHVHEDHTFNEFPSRNASKGK